jgi:hypothetical protein
MKDRLLKLTFLAPFLVASLILVAATVTAQDDPTIQAKIDNAMSAAPLSVSKDATILDNTVDADGKNIVLRKGTNNWTCFPDDLTTPMNNPACYDQVWMTWIAAAGAGEDPSLTVTTPGFSYMLQGDDAASNVDPGAKEPAAGEMRMASGPHIMILLPASVDMSGLGTDDHSSRWIMWAGTPYQHIMVATADMPEMSGMGS